MDTSQDGLCPFLAYAHLINPKLTPTDCFTTRYASYLFKYKS